MILLQQILESLPVSVHSSPPRLGVSVAASSTSYPSDSMRLSSSGPFDFGNTTESTLRMTAQSPIPSCRPLLNPTTSPRESSPSHHPSVRSGPPRSSGNDPHHGSLYPGDSRRNRSSPDRDARAAV